MMLSQMMRYTLLIVVISGIAGCSESSVQEIKQWMEDAKKDVKVAVPKLSEPKTFIPYIYSGKDAIDPYDPNKLLIVLARLKDKSSSALKPDQDRRKEPLEAYPLDAMKMVGTLEKPGLQYALLQIDKLVFQAKVGNYVGQNFGMITGIGEASVDIKEIVQDASGDWVERKAKLELQESKK